MRSLSDLLRMFKRRRFMKAMEPLWHKLSGVTEQELEKDFQNWKKTGGEQIADHVPNAKTRKALEEARKLMGKPGKYTNAEDLFRDLNRD